MTYRYRAAVPDDSAVLAPLNLALIRDEGHRNPMDIAQLEARMRTWLSGEYHGLVIESEGVPLGYALYRLHDDHVYLRQFYVVRSRRREGVGRAALAWLWANPWSGQKALRLDVLVENTVGRAFWRDMGMTEYCITLEGQPHRGTRT